MIAEMRINIDKSTSSRIAELDPLNLPFGKVFSDHMLVAEYSGNEWHSARILPYGKMEFAPTISALHYGQAIFEGLKADKNEKDETFLFRPLENLKRMNLSAQRLAMPVIPENLFMDGLIQLLRLDNEWILKDEGFSLYIRPMMFATDEALGVKISEKYKFIIITSPVGPYYREPVNVLIETNYTRACEGGIGFAKAAGNYAAALYPTKLAQEKGYQQLVWTDSKEHKYIEESGVMNVMFVVDDILITPDPSTGTILYGKTRDSLLTIARDMGVTVEERRVGVDEIIAALESGRLKEAFGTGTAATVAPIKKIGYKEKEYPLVILENSLSSKLRNELLGIRRGNIEDRYGWVIKIN
ncbi:MAG: branched-chain amino acid aminotransferase [Bacteroidia bacterium]